MIFHGLSFSNRITKYFIRTLAVLLAAALALCIGGCKKNDKDRTASDGETEPLTSALDTDISSEKLESTDDEPTTDSNSAGQDGTSRRNDDYAENPVISPESTQNSHISFDKGTMGTIGEKPSQGDNGQPVDKKEPSKETKPSLENTPAKETDSPIKDDVEKPPEPVETSVAEPSTNTYHNGIELPDIFF